MGIPRGTRIGVYEIGAMIGSGGMGEVYRAHDTKLGRDVAIKVLANRVAEDPVVRARIDREARVLAALNHPAIATIYGVEEYEGSPAIIMELVEGDPLSVRLYEGPLPLEQILSIARQVSDALIAAHDRGVVHRDLKPANIHMRPDGAVKVLDFGLAKSTDGKQVPMESQSVTTTGSIMGTAPYMSPEQARGLDVDRRTDIWAFGCTLFELLTGQRAFFGETPADTMVAVLSKEPDWDLLPATTPPGFRAFLERCLQKDLRKRLGSLGEASFDYGKTNPALAGAMATVRRRGFRRWLAIAVSIGAIASVVFLVMRLIQNSAGGGPLRKFEVQADGLGDDPNTFAGDTGPGAGVVISPDGRRIVYPAKGRLFVRELSQLTSRELDGTAGAVAPAWSPDSNWVAYVVGNQLRKSPITGGPTATIATMAGNFVEAGGAGWSADNEVYYTIGNGPLWRVNADGGDPVAVLDVEPGVLDYHDMTIGNGKPLWISHLTGNANSQHSIDIIDNGARKVLFGPVPQTLRHAAYSRSGHIVYQRVDSNPGIWAFPVDPRTLERTGDPFLVAPGGLRPSVAADGTLVYVTDESWGQVRFSFIDRSGKVIKDIGEQRRGLPRSPALSPTGDRMVFSAPTGERNELWMMDVATGKTTQLTFSGTRGDPQWDLDGSRIFFSCGNSGREGGVCAMPAAGGDASVIVPGASQPDLSPDGKSIAYILLDPKTRTDVWMQPLDKSSPPHLIRQTAAFDFGPKISPDGRWIAFASSESGQPHVFIADYPAAKRRWQISAESTAQAEWNPRGGELFFLSGTGRLQSVVVTDQGPSGKPKEMFAESVSRAHLTQGYVANADGQSFLVIRDVDRGSSRPRITVVENWFTEFAPKAR